VTPLSAAMTTALVAASRLTWASSKIPAAAISGAAVRRVSGGIANAGVGAMGMITDVALEDLDHVLAVNVRGVYLAAQAATVVSRQQRAFLAIDRFGTVDEVAPAVVYLAGPGGA
jgi:NAD(P)-dependent dehydrogenase (short-subunit alcohol dehydrogenase family)